MAKSTEQLITFISEAKKFSDVVMEQIKLLNEMAGQIQTTYQVPSDYLKQMKELAKAQAELAKANKENITTSANLEKIKQQELVTQQKQIDLERKQLSLSEQQRKATLAQEQASKRAEQAKEREVKKLLDQNSAYLKLTASWRNAQRAYADLLSTQGASSKEISKARKEFEKLDSRVKKVDSAVKNYSKNVGNYGSALSGLGGQLAGALGWAGALTTVVALGKSFYDTTKQLETLNKSMELGSRDTYAYASNMAFLQDITEKYGLELLSTSKAYNKFYVASKNKLSLEDIQLIFDKISKSASLMGISVYDQEGIFKALEQMMSKGTVQAEELRGQLGDRLPVAFETMSKAVGVSTRELGEMMQKGEIIASEVLPKFAIELEKAVGADKVDSIDNITTAENRMTTAWVTFVKEVNDGSSIITKVIKGVYNEIAETIEAWSNLLRNNDEIAIKVAGDKDIIKAKQQADKTGEDENAIIERQIKQNELSKNFYLQDIERIKKKMELAKQSHRLEYNQGFINNTKQLAILEESDKKLKARIEENKKLAIQDAENAKQIELDKAKAAQEIADKQAEKQAKENKKIADEAKRRNDAQAKAEQERLALAHQVAQAELELSLKNKYELELVDTKNAEERLDITLAYTMSKRHLIEQQYKEEERLAEGNADKIRLAEIKKINAIADNQKQLEKMTMDFVDKQEDEVQKGIDERKKLDEQEKKDAEERQKQHVDRMISYLSKYTDLGQFGFSSLNTIFDKNFQEIIKNGTGLERLQAIATVTGDVLKDIFNNVADVQRANFDAQMSRLDEEKNFAITMAGDNSAAKEEIERQYEEKRKELARKQAEAEKKQAIFNTTISIAQGIAAALPNLLLAGLVASLGAVQLGTIMATPIPEYWTGTDNAKEGLAWTQEKRAEVITDKKGNVKTFGHNKGATLTYMEQGDKVFKSQDAYLDSLDTSELDGILMSNNIQRTIEYKGVTASEMRSIMNDSVSNIIVESTIFDELGINKRRAKMSKKQTKRNRYANS